MYRFVSAPFRCVFMKPTVSKQLWLVNTDLSTLFHRNPSTFTIRNLPTLFIRDFTTVWFGNVATIVDGDCLAIISGSEKRNQRNVNDHECHHRWILTKKNLRRDFLKWKEKWGAQCARTFFRRLFFYETRPNSLTDTIASNNSYRRKMPYQTYLLTHSLMGKLYIYFMLIPQI